MKPEYITIVSGLPRSGTSMMMRVLEAGGISSITDAIRAADIDNPNGYYEFERIKKVKEDASWLPEAYGKVVKAIYMLLYDLPATHSYRVIFMTRRLEEVIASQNAMLQRSGKDDSELDTATLQRIFEAHLDKIKSWLAQQPNFDVHYVSYNAFLTEPSSQIDELAEFLGGALDRPAMLAVVDPALYRQKG